MGSRGRPPEGLWRGEFIGCGASSGGTTFGDDGTLAAAAELWARGMSSSSKLGISNRRAFLFCLLAFCLAVFFFLVAWGSI